MAIVRRFVLRNASRAKNHKKSEKTEDCEHSPVQRQFYGPSFCPIRACSQLQLGFTSRSTYYRSFRTRSSQSINFARTTNKTINPLSPILFLIVAKMSLPGRSAPYWSNPPFSNFLTFGHSGAQSRAPECPNVKKFKKGGLDQYGPKHLEMQANHLIPLGLKGLND